MKRILSMFLLLTLLCTLGMTQAFAEAEETTLIVAQSVDASTMDPQKQGGMSSMNVLINMFDTLVFRDSEGNLIPGLATEWEALDDLTWQFKLREGVTFHNGYPFTAEDVKFSLERLINPDTGSPIVELAALDHVDIVDDYLAGIAAGLNTKVNKLGYVGAKPFAEVISGFTAFFLGARSVNPDVTMEVIYTNEWSSATLEAQAAQALIDMGCDVISQHSDTTSPATTAEAGGVLHVGYNNDMIPAAPNASLISARIDWSHYMKYALECMMSGEPIATDWTQGWAERTVYLSPLNTAIAAEGTQEAIDAAAAKFDDGSLHVWQGPLYDSEGNPAQIMSWDGSSVVYTFSDEVYEEPNSAPQFNAIIEGIHINE